MTQEALKLALEAMEFIPESGSMLGAHAEAKRLEAITAIKEALAQPAQQEPEHIVRSNGRYSPLLTRMMNERVKSNLKQVIELYDSPDQPPQRKPLTREKEIALQEGYLADAEKTYFEARADCLNTAQNRKLFEAGFNRGWEAAHGIKGET